VQPSDLRGYTQAHFFAGLGGWAYALRLAGWPDDREVWTGSCPCQPFSDAGKRKGTADERHLWPDFHRLIAECSPATVFGEQVASKDGLAWLDTVSTDMENAGYAFGAADLCAAGVGAPHIRQRLWFVGHATINGIRSFDGQPGAGARSQEPARGSSISNGMGDACRERGRRDARTVLSSQGEGSGERSGVGRLANEPVASSTTFLLGDACRSGLARRSRQSRDDGTEQQASCGDDASRRGADFWRGAEWLPCTDGKARPVEPGSFPLAHGVPARVAKLRAFGNAISPQVAAEFIRAADRA
jgi:DNA (cytosine-5)-methyltransferase 1